MSTTLKVLVPPAELTAAAALLYTCPALTRAVIKKAVATNQTAAAHTVTVYLVPSGGAAGAGNAIINVKPVPPNTSPSCDVELYSLENMIMQPGDTIYGFADTASTVTLMVSGAEVQ